MAKKDASYVVTADFEINMRAANGARTKRKYRAGDPFQLPENWAPDAEFVENLKHPHPAFRETYVIEYRGEDGRMHQEDTFRRVLVPIAEADA